MNLLVTGAAGFIGSNFVSYVLADTTHSVISLDRLTYAGSRDNLEPEGERHVFVEGDIRDEGLISHVLTEHDVDAVVNFAAETHVDRSIDDASQFVATNVEGVRSLLSAIRDHPVDRFVQLSTDEVYGEIQDGKFKETDNLAPRNPYSATKAAADHLVRSFHETHGIPTLIVRPSNNFGPRQHSEKLIPKLIMRAKQGEKLPIYGDGTNVREWTYVRDTARAIVRLLEVGEPGEAYNVGSGHERQNIEVARMIVDLVGSSEDLIEFVEDRPGHDHRYALDSTKLRSLGWEPRWSFEDGLRKTIASLKDDDRHT